MAKLKAPLLSLGAAGAIGRTLVFFPWKGIDCVREYVIPSNPKTAPQTTQRGYLTAAVSAIHAAQAQAANPLDEEDQIANSALASAKGLIMTWFNQITKLWIDVKVAGKSPIVYSNGNIVDTLTTNIIIGLEIWEETPDDLNNGKFYFGTSKTNLIHKEIGTLISGQSININGVDLSAFLTAGNKYYVQMRPDSGDPCEGADSGIYSFVAT